MPGTCSTRKTPESARASREEGTGPENEEKGEDVIRTLILRWAKSREPDFIIGGHARPYLRRHWLLPRNPVFNVYVHEFLRSDDDRALHDHPWAFNLSWLMEGRYIEWVPSHRMERGPHDDAVWVPDPQRPIPKFRRTGQFLLRWGGAAHRIQLHAEAGRELPCWTLFITGPRVRDWGFYCPRGWVHWRVFTAADDRGAVGRGCEP